MTELPGWLKLATVWLLLATGLFLAVQAWQDRQEATQFSVASAQAGGTIDIRRSRDGHYHWPGRVATGSSSREVDFLVDTGATRTALPQALARELNLEKVGEVRVQTAAGEALAEVVLVDLALQGGVRAERLRVTALAELNKPLLGMDVLGRLQLSQQAGVLRIEGAPGARLGR
jgi:aspartyl protease family protein